MALFMLSVAAIITMFLFYIDEGYYNFNWMKSFGNWVVFVIYVLLLTLIQVACWFVGKTVLRLSSLIKKEH